MLQLCNVITSLNIFQSTQVVAFLIPYDIEKLAPTKSFKFGSDGA